MDIQESVTNSPFAGLIETPFSLFEYERKGADLAPAVIVDFPCRHYESYLTVPSESRFRLGGLVCLMLRQIHVLESLYTSYHVQLFEIVTFIRNFTFSEYG